MYTLFCCVSVGTVGSVLGIDKAQKTVRQNVLQASKLCTQVAKGRVSESLFAPYVMQRMVRVTLNVFNKLVQIERRGENFCEMCCGKSHVHYNRHSQRDGAD